ncbi:hypothetical protein [Nocardioides lacusdianchii]|uniref:hypothetical protein n=1 Tax=Nocardioides lacusdianchii TaxID=2783664 RepID=UPI001CCB8CFE|nr:hypothetical protein [Nocardioides lacusdianchii]
MRPLPLMAAGLLAATLLTSPTAYAAAETCQGQPATIVGTFLQQDLTGTEGPDVVVTNGATVVKTLGGDDLVCVTDEPGRRLGVRVDTGPGDDVVDGTFTLADIEAVLGSGSDTYSGSPARDQVVTGDGSVDNEQDIVSSGVGSSATNAGDQVRSGARGVPNSDVLVLGGIGSEVLWSGPMAAGARLDVGPNSTLVPDLGAGDVSIDAASGTMTTDGVQTLAWTGPFTSFTLFATVAPRSLEVTGSDRDEFVYTSFTDGDGRQRYDLGAGDDTVLSPDGAGGAGSRYAGGAGEDDIDLWAGDRLDLDLASGKLEMRQDGRTVKGRFDGFETSRLGAQRVEILGTKRADEIRFYACRATVRGRGGKDDISSYRTGEDGYLLDCDARKSRIKIYGDGGRDTIGGSRGKDLLVGGKGRDTINGNANRDTCSGEKLKSCEIKRR